jgi:plasmid stabilization system protein ParE
MPKKRPITFAESAFRDIEAIRAWYAEQNVASVGERVIREIISSVERLAHFPESGRIVPEFENPNLREVIHPPFRIVYRLEENKVKIVRVWRSEKLLHVP